jgi:hypothetical protein
MVRMNNNFINSYYTYDTDLYNKVVIYSININPKTFIDINKNYQTNEICLEAIQKSWKAIKFMRPELKTLEISTIAVNNSWKALQYIPNKIKTLEICKKAYAESANVIRHINVEFFPQIYTDTCSICMDDEQLQYTLLNCNHIFCTDCTKYIVGTKCSLCRSDVDYTKYIHFTKIN